MALRRQSGITLIELLVSMTILAVVTATIIVAWISLEDSFSYSTRSSEQRDFARDAITAVARDVRDAQSPSTDFATPAITSAQAYSISVYTRFHSSGDETGSKLVQYSIMADASHPGSYALYRKIGGQDWQLVVSHVVNMQEETPLFAYSYIDSGGLVPTPLPSAVPSDMTDRIVNVRIQLMVDLNPGHSPSPMTLTTTVQPRNLRST